jgi:hypothetical protein
MKQRIKVTLAGQVERLIDSFDDDTALKFEVLPCGALLVFNENIHAAWNVASYPDGQWWGVEFVKSDDEP